MFLPTGIKLIPLGLTALDLSWDPTPSMVLGKEDWLYEVTCQQGEYLASKWSFQLPANSTGTLLTMLMPRHKYQCRVGLSSWVAGLSCPTVSAWTLSDGK